MASKSFSEALTNLSSDKIKDRTQGLHDARVFLTVPRNIAWMNQERRQWLKLLQAIFQIIVDEQKVHEKKSTSGASAALKRLKDGAQVVRLIIERCAQDIPRKAFKAILNHIISIIVYNKRLFEPIALDYLKALRTVLSYQPHLDHLDEQQWCNAVAMCFSGILGDPIRTYEIVEEQMMEEQDDEGNEDTEITETAVTSSTQSNRKRKALGPLRMTPLDQNGFTTSSPSPMQARAASQEIIELMQCVATLFQYSSSPFLTYGNALLAKFARFFRAYPQETSAHASALTALNKLISDLFYNARTLLENASVQLWPFLSPLWGTKSLLVKEQLVIAADALLPFLIHRNGPPHTEYIQELLSAILSEPDNRWGTQDLDINRVAFLKPSEPIRAEAFTRRHFRAGQSFDMADAISWSILELGAQCLRHVQNAYQSLRPELPLTPSRSSSLTNGRKRSRLDAPLLPLFDDLQSTNNRLVLLRLQLLLFLFSDPEVDSCDAHLAAQALPAVFPLLSHANAQIQSWTFVLCASLAQHAYGQTPASQEAIGGTKDPQRQLWVRVWDTALRRLHLPQISRAACLTLNNLQKYGLIENDRRLQDLGHFARDLELLGPSFPSDSVCDFLTGLLESARLDARLFLMQVPEKIVNRMSSHWNLMPKFDSAARSFSAKPPWEALDTTALVDLLSAMSLLPADTPSSPVEHPLPDCLVVEYKVKCAQEAPLFGWYFSARLPDHTGLAPSNGPGTDSTDVSTADPSSDNAVAATRRCSSFLRKELVAIQTELSDEEASGVLPDVMKLRRIIDIVTVALCYEAKADACEVIRSERNYDIAAAILAEVIPQLSNSRWSPHERAYLLSGLGPLALPAEDHPVEYPAMVGACETSGIKRELLPKKAVRVPSNHGNLRCLWGIDSVRAVLVKNEEVFQRILGTDAFPSQSTHGADELPDDGFGAIKTTTSSQMTGRAMYHARSARATATCLSLCIRIVTTSAYFDEGGRAAIRLRDVVKDMLQGTGNHLIALGLPVLVMVDREYVQLASSEIEGLLERIGGELLPSYEYARSERLQVFVLRFLRSTARLWGKVNLMEDAFVDNARKLSAWFTAQLLEDAISSYRIRNALIDLLSDFLTFDLDGWGHESEERACIDDSPIPPISILIESLKDPDLKTRFKLAPHLGSLCAYAHQAQQQESTIWEDIASARGFDISGNGFENNITLLLSYGNIIVSSDLFRASAYKPIILYAALNPAPNTSLYIRSLLDAISTRLGLRSVAELYCALAPYTMAEQIINNQEGLVIPDPTAFGFASQHDLYQSRFQEVAAMVLAGPRPDFFGRMCTYVGKTEAAAKWLCLPNFAAYKLTLPLSAGADVDRQAEEEAGVALLIQQVAKDIGQSVQSLTSSIQDLVLEQTFSFIWEPCYDMATFERALRQDWPIALGTLQGIFGSDTPPFRPNVLSPPDIGLQTILKVISGPHPLYKNALTDPAVLYSTLHRLLSSSQAATFVSQQTRLLYSAAICIACATPAIVKHSGLLTLLLSLLVRFLEQQDLAFIAARMYRWTLSKYNELPAKAKANDSFSASLLAGASMCTALSQTPDAENVGWATTLMQDLENVLAAAIQSQDTALSSIAKGTLCMWPRDHALHGGLTFQDITTSLISSKHPFFGGEVLPRLLRKDGHNAERQARLSRIAWQYFAVSTSSASGQQPDLGVVSDLLLEAGCSLDGPRLDELTGHSGPTVLEYDQIKQSILHEICALLSHPTLSTAMTAFDALHALYSVHPPLNTDELPTDIRLITASHLARLPKPANTHVSHSLEVLLQDSWAKKARRPAEWQVELVRLLLALLGTKDPFFQTLLLRARLVEELSAFLLPILVHTALLCDQQHHFKARHHLSAYFETLLLAKSPCAADVVKVIVYLRGKLPPGTPGSQSTPLSNDHWLSIPWFLLAQTAVRAAAHTSALLFLELAVEHDSLQPIEAGLTTTHTKEVQDLLYSIYENIDEPDGFYSIKASNVQRGMLKKLEHEGRWNSAMMWHAAGIEGSEEQSERAGSIDGVMQAMASLDLPHLAMSLLAPSLRGAISSDGSVLPSGLPFDLAWRTEQWDLPSTFRQGAESSQANIFRIVKANERELDKGRALASANTALHAEVAKLGDLAATQSLRGVNTIRTVISINQVKRWIEAKPLSPELVPSLSRGLSCIPFEAFQSVVDIRLSLFRGLRRSERRGAITDEPSPLELATIASERDHLLELSRRSRASGQLQKALNTIVRAKDLIGNDSAEFATELEMAQVMWANQEHGAAVEVLHRLNLLSQNSVAAREDTAQHALLLSYLGSWSATARLEAPSTIRDTYFEKAIALLTAAPTEDATFGGDVRFRYAQFADEQYQQSNSQVVEMNRLEAFAMSKEQDTLTGRKRRGGSQASSDASSPYEETQSQRDRRTVEAFRAAHQAFLETALAMYGQTLASCDHHDHALYRFCSLWLENGHNVALNDLANTIIVTIPSHKFIVLVPQLSARLSSAGQHGSSDGKHQTSQQQILQDLILRICTDHPHHSLFQVLFLRENQPQQPKAVAMSRRISQGSPLVASQIRRAEAVELLISRILKRSKLALLLQNVSTAIEAYIEYANLPTKKDKDLPPVRDIPPQMKILKLKNCPIPVTTLTIPVDKTRTYHPTSMVCIKHFVPSYGLVGGINVPKVTTCIGSDGRRYKQLYKGGDDTRQDAVMEQVFTIANDLLRRDERTHRRSLAIRTYKIVPLTSNAGVMEFVSNSRAIGDWLIPAHDRFNPNDMKIGAARKALGTLHDRPRRERIAKYREIRSKVRPVMRHFFTEKHYIPSRWFEMRLNYSRSVAVMSMVGHVLGIGDRHVSNILIDAALGELIPIDFGIAFEGGKALPTPEHVPFRLTEDIVDGFGLSGVDGVFRKCSEETLRVLRARSAVLMTILEVFKFDPLQKWSASVHKVRRLQGTQAMPQGIGPEGDSETTMTDADRAIRTVSEKLRTNISVEYQVNELILQARDDENLGSIFFGWQPYL